MFFKTAHILAFKLIFFFCKYTRMVLTMALPKAKKEWPVGCARSDSRTTYLQARTWVAHLDLVLASQLEYQMDLGEACWGPSFLR